jgi:hypothetical protein
MGTFTSGNIHATSILIGEKGAADIQVCAGTSGPFTDGEPASPPMGHKVSPW